jgi:hypothetical protein
MSGGRENRTTALAVGRDAAAHRMTDRVDGDSRVDRSFRATGPLTGVVAVVAADRPVTPNRGVAG